MPLISIALNIIAGPLKGPAITSSVLLRVDTGSRRYAWTRLDIFLRGSMQPTKRMYGLLN